MALSGLVRALGGIAERAIAPVGVVADEVPRQCAVLAEVEHRALAAAGPTLADGADLVRPAVRALGSRTRCARAAHTGAART